MHSRRFACFLLGVWFGGEVLMAWIVASAYRSVDSLPLDASPAATLHIREAGAAGVRLMRYQAAEQVREFVAAWGLAEICVGSFVFLFLLFGTHEGKASLGIALLMLVMVMLQRFLLTPEIAALGRMLDFASVQALPAERSKLGVLDDVNWGMELLKWGMGAVLMVRLMLHRRSGDARKQVNLVDKPNHGHIDR